jgi:hypothetical protein
VGRTGSARGEGRVGAHGRGRRARARAGEGWRRERRGEERGIEGELTSGLDDRRQLLTGIPPRARGGGKEGEGSCYVGKENEREKGRTWGERGAPRRGRVGSGHTTGQARPRTGPTTHYSHSLIYNRI